MGKLQEVGFKEGTQDRKDWVSWEQSEALWWDIDGLSYQGKERKTRTTNQVLSPSACQL